MTSRRLAIHLPSSRVGLGDKVFGKDVANFDLFRAMVRQGGFDQVDFLTHAPLAPEAVVSGLEVGPACATRVTTANVLTPGAMADAGVLLRGTPQIEELAWLRRTTAGDRAFSLIGLIHTIAPPAVREQIGMAAIAPTQAWDALICTSPAVQSAMTRMFDEWADYLGTRFGGGLRVRPMLPLIPLGVDAATFEARADRPAARADMRRALGLEEGDLLVIWVGRLSYFEKAFPQPMMRAVAEAAARTGKRVHFAMAGWFPGGGVEERMYREAADAYGPDIGFHLVDGNDREALGRLWAAADIFLSLVDNIQETFGITPLEAMASGLPVVVSDWDGYRYTVQDGVQGFLIPTLGGPEGGMTDDLAASHGLGIRSYQQYVGIVAQHTAVDVEAAVQALVRLIDSESLRKTMGAAGRERVRRTFDWSVVAPQYRALADELTAIRGGGDGVSITSRHPVKGDPLRDFAGFASQVLTPDTVLNLREGAGEGDLDRAWSLRLDMFAASWRGGRQECVDVVRGLGDGPATVRDVLRDVPAARRRRVCLSLLWMAKIGVLTWG